MDFSDIPRITDRSSHVNGTVSLYTILNLTAIMKKYVKEINWTQQICIMKQAFYEHFR
jgi:hypothetical protein